MKIYRLLTTVLYPFIYLYLLYRKYCNKEDNTSFAQKLGNNLCSKKEGFLIWIHTVSVGEYSSIKLLIKELKNIYNIHILVTTTTLSAAKVIKDDDLVTHQYLPIDNKYIVKKFLKHWQPNLALWVDSEIWPVIIDHTAQICPMILINAKLSDKSYSRWRYFPKIFHSILENFEIILPQTVHYSQRFKFFNLSNVKYIGNMKYAATNISLNPIISDNIQNLFIFKKTILIAASTHAGEELLITNAYRDLKKQFSEIFLIIVPRHPSRLNNILTKLDGFNIVVRSKQQAVDNHTEIYIVDTIGELNYFYNVSDIAFIGGSFSEIGGHNPLEAANSNCALIYGPNYTGFQEIVEEFIDEEAIYIINNAEDYIKIVTKLLNDHSLLNKRKLNAKRIITDKAHVITKYLEEISAYIDQKYIK